MAEQRLIDANKEVIRAYEDIPEPYSDVLISFLRGCETIDPESLPIVQQLRAELAKVKAEKDALLKELAGECGVCSHYEDCIKNHCSCCDGSNWEYCGPKKER